MADKKDVYRELLKVAFGAAQNAYAPYSKFKVGAALLTKSSKVFTGANIENSSYGLTICAERVAIFNAVSSGHRDIEAVAVCAPIIGRVAPCGACRQVISEFGNDIKIVLGSFEYEIESDESPIQIFPISALLPVSFGAEDLAKIAEKESMRLL